VNKYNGDNMMVLWAAPLEVKGRLEPVVCWQINRIGQVAAPKPASAREVPIGRAAVAGYH
jgi:hypothetical protein